MDRLEELRIWFQSAPLGKKFPLRLDGLLPGFAEVSMETQTEDLVAAGPIMIVQGGVLAVLADAAAVMAAMSALPSGHTPLAHLSYELRSPTTLADSRLVAIAEVWTQDARNIWVNVKVLSASYSPAGDNLKAVFSARFAKPRNK